MNAKRIPQTITKPSSAPDSWYQDLERGGKDNTKILGTPANLLSFVRNHPDMKGAVRFNTLLTQIEIVRLLPGDIDTGKGPISDVHLHAVVAWLSAEHGVHVKPNQVSDALTLAAREHVIDPPGDYMRSLTWDGVERVRHYAARYLGAEPTAYNERVSLILFVSIAARALKPGCKVDTVVILEGAQGAGKTTAVLELCNPEWCVEVTESVGSPELVRQIRSALIAELGELSSMTRSAFNRTKQFFTQLVDLVREPYARFVVRYPRRCVFIGTTNADDWNRDPTGARRFLPLPVRAFDMQSYLPVRDQLWAEAAHLALADFDYWTLPESAVEEQDARYDHDTWADPIARWLNGKNADKDYPTDLDTRATDQGGGIRSASCSEILIYALDIETGKHSKVDQMRVANCMKKMGWPKERPWRDGARTVRYVRPKEKGDDVPF